MGDKMTMREAAEFLGIKEQTLRNWIWKGTAPRSYKYLNRVYFNQKDLEAFKRDQTEVRAS